MLNLCLNKIRCKFGYHRWNYSDEDFKLEFQLPDGLQHLQVSFPDHFPDQIVTYKIRICKSCYKKQRWEPLKWENCHLSKQENRDKVMDQLGI